MRVWRDDRKGNAPACRSSRLTGICTDNMNYQPMNTAPKDGQTIIGLYDDGTEARIFWSDRPVCMLGNRCGGFPEGWATDGSETDYNLPMDEPLKWRQDS